MDMKSFVAEKEAFLAKHGDTLLYADEEARVALCRELEPLAKFSKIPPDRLLAALASVHAERVLR